MYFKKFRGKLRNLSRTVVCRGTQFEKHWFSPVLFNLFHTVTHFPTQRNLATHFGKQNLISSAKIWWSLKARFHYERGKEHSLFPSLIFDWSERLKLKRAQKKAIKQTKMLFSTLAVETGLKTRVCKYFLTQPKKSWLQLLRPTIWFALQFRYFSPKIMVISKKKKDLHFDLISNLSSVLTSPNKDETGLSTLACWLTWPFLLYVCNGNCRVLLVLTRIRVS